MRPAGLILALCFGGVACAQGVISEWLPLKVDDKWVYQHDSRDQIGSNEFESHSGKTEETVTGSWTTPAVTLIGRHVRVIDGTDRTTINFPGDPRFSFAARASTAITKRLPGIR